MILDELEEKFSLLMEKFSLKKQRFTYVASLQSVHYILLTKTSAIHFLIAFYSLYFVINHATNPTRHTLACLSVNLYNYEKNDI